MADDKRREIWIARDMVGPLNQEHREQLKSCLDSNVDIVFAQVRQRIGYRNSSKAQLKQDSLFYEVFGLYKEIGLVSKAQLRSPPDIISDASNWIAIHMASIYLTAASLLELEEQRRSYEFTEAA